MTDKFEEWLESSMEYRNLVARSYTESFLKLELDIKRQILEKYRELNSTQMTHCEPVDINNS
jgi:hypothetical protein